MGNTRAPDTCDSTFPRVNLSFSRVANLIEKGIRLEIVRDRALPQGILVRTAV